jgi:RNA polymerase sigma-70 factor (ECF subfamily)
MNLTDEDIFGSLYRLYRQRYILFAKSYIRNKSDAEDIVSDAFAVLWEKRNSLAVINVQAYMLSIVKNKKLLTHYRYQKR